MDGGTNALPATQIPLGRWNGDRPEKKRNLLQFATRRMAEPDTRPAKIVRRKPLDACFAGALPNHVPDGFLRQSIAPRFPVLNQPPKPLAGGEVGRLKPLTEEDSDPARHGYRPGVAGFALPVDAGPVVFPLLYVAEIRAHGPVPPKAASEQDRQERPVTFALQKLTVGRVPEPLGLFWREPIPEPYADLLDTLPASHAGDEVGALETAVGSLVSEAAHGAEAEIGGARRQMPGFEVYAIPEDDGLAEG